MRAMRAMRAMLSIRAVKAGLRTGLPGLALGLGLLVMPAAAAPSAGDDAQGAAQATEPMVSGAASGKSSWAQQWGPATGSRAPAISAPDQDGVTRSLDALGRANGLLIIFNRSADW